jgi:hypothetical protein
MGKGLPRLDESPRGLSGGIQSFNAERRARPGIWADYAPRFCVLGGTSVL